MRLLAVLACSLTCWVMSSCRSPESPANQATSSGHVDAGTPDSTVWGADRRRSGHAARIAPEVALLEELIDRYEALDVAMDALWRGKSGAPIAGGAWKRDRGEEAIERNLRALLSTEYHEAYVPAPPDVSVLPDSIRRLGKAEAGRALSVELAKHDRWVAARIAEIGSVVTNPTVRMFLERLAAEETAEAAKLEAQHRP